MRLYELPEVRLDVLDHLTKLKLQKMDVGENNSLTEFVLRNQKLKSLHLFEVRSRNWARVLDAVVAHSVLEEIGFQPDSDDFGDDNSHIKLALAKLVRRPRLKSINWIIGPPYSDSEVEIVLRGFSNCSLSLRFCEVRVGGFSQAHFKEIKNLVGCLVYLSYYGSDNSDYWKDEQRIGCARKAVLTLFALRAFRKSILNLLSRDTFNLVAAQLWETRRWKNNWPLRSEK